MTISIFGTNDAITITTDPVRVSEEGLPSGIADGNFYPDDTTNLTEQSGTFDVFRTVGGPLEFSLTAPVETMTSGGQVLTWTGDGTQHLVGSIVYDGEGSDPVIDIVIDNDGNYTVKLLGPVTTRIPRPKIVASFNVSVVVTDGIVTSYGTLAVGVEDDAPSVAVSLADVATDALTVNESNLAANASANFADNFGSAGNYGADGAGTTTSAYTLECQRRF